MAVVINEFEVLDTPPQTQGAGSDPSSAAPPAPPIEPEDLRHLLGVTAELQLRRLAH